MLEQIARSDDLHAVRVYADFLLEQDPARAEFVEIQLRRAKHLVQDGDTIRSRVLLEKHWREWLGSAAEVVAPTSLRFEHGVLRECRLIDPGNDEARLNAAHHVQLSTLRCLRTGTMPAPYAIGVIESVARLRTLHADVALLKELTHRKTRIDTLLECARHCAANEPAVDWIAALENLAGTPNLRAIDLGPLFTDQEVLAVLNDLRAMKRWRGIPTLRAEIRSPPPQLEDIAIAERVGRFVTGAANVVADCIDARTLRSRTWLLFEKDHASSRLEIEAYNPEDVAGLLSWVEHPTIGHVLVRSPEAISALPLRQTTLLERALEVWNYRGVEIVLPDAWTTRPP
jgi:hypothetical protein